LASRRRAASAARLVHGAMGNAGHAGTTPPADIYSPASCSPPPRKAYAFPVFEGVLKEFGLTKAIRTNNGVPFRKPQCPLRPGQALRLVAQAARTSSGCRSRRLTGDRAHIQCSYMQCRSRCMPGRLDGPSARHNEKRPSAAVVKGATAAPGLPSRRPLRHAGSNRLPKGLPHERLV